MTQEAGFRPSPNTVIPYDTRNLPGERALPTVWNGPHYTPPPPCHEEGKYLFTIGEAKIHAGGSKAPDIEGKEWDLVINLTGYASQEPDIRCHNGAEVLCPRFTKFVSGPTDYPELVIDWPDGRVPYLRRKDWRRLIEDLTAVKGDVLVHCMGGHGRTGTLLAILGYISGAIDHSHDPVVWLRANYCERIIESHSQIDYLVKNMQVKTKAGPRYVAPVYAGQGYWRDEIQRAPLPGSPQDALSLTSRANEAHGRMSYTDTERFRCIKCEANKPRWAMYLINPTLGEGTCHLCACTTRQGSEYDVP